MDALLTILINKVVVSTLAILAGILCGYVCGYVVGSRHSGKQKHALQHALNEQSLDMLDLKTEHTNLSKSIGQFERKDRLLKLSLSQLSSANAQVQTLQKRLDSIEKQHYIETLRLRLVATESVIKARRARKIAALATKHAKRFEAALPNTQTINAPPPKSYGQAAAVPVKVVDQHSPDALHDSMVRVSHRDSSLFAKLPSSNEGQRFNSAILQTIDCNSPSGKKNKPKADILNQS